MRDLEQISGSQWDDALCRAAAAACSGRGAIRLFYERRADVRVELTPGEAPRILRTGWSGISLDRNDEGASRTFFADPDLAALESVSASGVFSRAGPAVTPSWPELNWVAETLAGLQSALDAIEGAGSPVSASCVAFEQHVRIVPPDGPLARDARRGLRYRFEVHRSDPTGRRVVAATEGTQAASSPLDGVELRRALEATAERAEQRLGAHAARSGQREIVLAPGSGGVLIHEIVGHALEGDTVLAGQSWLAAASEPVAPRRLLILDDPRRGRAPWRVDDEGQPARATPLVRDGRVDGWLLDSRTAALTTRSSTGHGRRSSYREPVKPRMGCTFVAASEYEGDDLVSAVADGIYVRRMRAGTVDTTSGRAVFRVTDADRIVAGRIDAPLHPFVLEVDGRSALATMRAGEDVAFDTCVGSCQRHGQPLSTSVGAPTMWIGLCKVIS